MGLLTEVNLFKYTIETDNEVEWSLTATFSPQNDILIFKFSVS